METKEKIIAQLGKAVGVMASLCLVLAAIIVLMLNSRFETDVEMEGKIVEDPAPPYTPVNDYSSEGGKLFKTHCAVCHSISDRTLTGPGLAGVLNRVPSEEWLRMWIKNADAMKKSKDPYAMKIDKEYPGTMNSFTFLSDKEIDAVIGFITDEK